MTNRASKSTRDFARAPSHCETEAHEMRHTTNERRHRDRVGGPPTPQTSRGRAVGWAAGKSRATTGVCNGKGGGGSMRGCGAEEVLPRRRVRTPSHVRQRGSRPFGRLEARRRDVGCRGVHGWGCWEGRRLVAEEVLDEASALAARRAEDVEARDAHDPLLGIKVLLLRLDGARAHLEG